MTCPECLDLLQRRLDGEAIDRVGAESHFLNCPVCQAQWEAADRLEQGLRLLKAPQPPQHLTRAITAAVLRDRAVGRRRHWLQMAAAAALLVAPWLGAFVFLNNGQPTPLAENKPAPLGNPLRAMKASLAGVGEGLLDLSREQTQAVQTATRPLEVSPITVVAVEDSPPPRGPSGLEIVGNSTQRALAFLAHGD